jgi:hypothetical protein
VAFKNISDNLVELIENVPNILSAHDAEEETAHKLLTDSANPLE